MSNSEMCNSCIHKAYCMAAFKKDHWCGNHTTWMQGRRTNMAILRAKMEDKPNGKNRAGK